MIYRSRKFHVGTQAFIWESREGGIVYVSTRIFEDSSCGLTGPLQLQREGEPEVLGKIYLCDNTYILEIQHDITKESEPLGHIVISATLLIYLDQYRKGITNDGARGRRA